MWAHGGCGTVERSRTGSTTEHKRQEWGGQDAAYWVLDHRGAPAGAAERGPGCTQDGNQTLSQREDTDRACGDVERKGGSLVFVQGLGAFY